jgi:hypothetical protein
MLCHWGFPVDRTTDAASTPTYKEKQMAIGAIQGAGGFYDANRDMFYSEQERYEREMHQRKMYAAQQQMGHNQFVISASATGAMIGTLQCASTHDPKDPLSFLSKADTKILLTGELA